MIIRRKKYKRIDYYNKKFVNPFFRRRKIKKVRTSGLIQRNKLIIFLTLSFLVGLLWFFCFSSIFNINNIIINNLNRISKQEIEDIVYQQMKTRQLLFFPQRNLILFSKKDFQKNVEKKYYFKNLSIKKKFPKSIIINIQEEPCAFILQEEGRYYYVDIEGYIIDEINPLDIKKNSYPLIYNDENTKIYSGKIDIDSNHINYIISLADKLNNNYDFLLNKDNKDIKLEIEKFALSQEINTVKMVMLGGPTIYFNTEEDQVRQINKLIIIKNDKLKNDFINKIYIDLRYGDKVYYR